MFKPKTTIAGRLGKSSGVRFETHDLRVMSPTKFESWYLTPPSI